MSESLAANRVAVIGAGPMGLAAAYELMNAGARSRSSSATTDRRHGRHIDFAGTRIERYYHFICAPDDTTSST